MVISQAVITLLESGPCPDTLDPWVENAHYFHQLHGELLSAIVGALRPMLTARGYTLGREASLQIAERRTPDISIQTRNAPGNSPSWDYAAAAVGVLADVGVSALDLYPLDMLTIRDQTSRLVTVMEVISPRNKDRDSDILQYNERRNRLYLDTGVNVVELDLTRSVKRLLAPEITQQTAYHAAIFIPDNDVRVIGMAWGEALKRIAVPLVGDVVPLDLQHVYVTAYRNLALADQMQTNGAYTSENLPYPTLLSNDQRAQALEAVVAWQAELAQERAASR